MMQILDATAHLEVCIADVNMMAGVARNVTAEHWRQPDNNRIANGICGLYSQGL